MAPTIRIGLILSFFELKNNLDSSVLTLYGIIKTMAKVKLGPFSKIHISLLQQKLEKDGITFDCEEDPDLLRRFAEKSRRQAWNEHPAFSGNPEYIYIEIEKEHLLRIKKDLDHMGFAIVDSTDPGGGDDYYCPSCRYTATQPGTCPKHGLQLLDFSGWVDKNRSRQLIRSQWLFRICFLMTVAMFLYWIIDHAKDYLK